MPRWPLDQALGDIKADSSAAALGKRMLFSLWIWRWRSDSRHDRPSYSAVKDAQPSAGAR